MKFDISGKWKFFADAEKKGSERIFDEDFKVMETVLPGTVSESKLTEKKEGGGTGYLWDPYLFEGYAWYSREVSLPEEMLSDDLFTLKFERARKTTVWIDGVLIGSCDSLCTPHKYDISGYVKKSFVLTVLSDNTSYPTKGGHMTSPDTQTNWNGILGDMAVYSEKKGVLRDVYIIADTENNAVKISFENIGCGRTDISAEGLIQKASLTLKEGINEFILPVEENIVTWSEFTPKTYTVRISTDSGNNYSFSFGYRKMTAAERENKSYCFMINGTEILLRGKHDGMIFPMTGYAPTDRDSWVRVMKTAKSYGINHYRFHTCTPPDAAFYAADELGIYMEPELPFWGTIHAKDDKDCSLEEQEYLINEGIRIIKEFSHHPSFVMMSLGNELWGSAERINEIIGIFKGVNSDILYTGGSNNFQFFPTEVKNEDFFVGVRFDKEYLIRGSYAMCDAPLGFVQTERPNTSHDYDIFFNREARLEETEENGEIEIQYGTGTKKVKTFGGGGYIPEKPVISHEVGQYVTYPDFDDIPEYTGVLKPVNLEIFEQRLKKSGMERYARENFMNSGRFAAMCYKLEIEAARRSRCLAGYQLLDIQDFTGQGTATVGILNAFMKSKKTVSLSEWNSFNGATVIMAAFDSFLLYDGDEFTAEIIVSHYDGTDISGRTVRVNFLGESYELSLGKVKKHGVYSVGNLHMRVRCGALRSERLRLSAGEYENEYTLYLFPKESVDVESYNRDGLVVSSDAKSAVKSAAEGNNVLLFAEGFKGIESVYCTDFWCYGMFSEISRSVGKPEPVGTLGLSIRRSHGALREMKCRSCTTPKWYDIITNSKCMILDGTDIDPIIRTIDNPERNHRLALLFEAKVGSGKIIVCSLPYDKVNVTYAVSAYVKSICEYASSRSFDPETEVSEETLLGILSE